MKNKPAYALIFVFVTMTILLIFVASAAETIHRSLAEKRDLIGADDAHLAAQSASETAILAMKDYNAGYDIALTEKAFCLYADATTNTTGDGDCTTWADYTVYSTAQTNSNDTGGYYYTPIPGTGSAASEDDCTVSDSDHDGDFEEDVDVDVDHPCNWNKLMYGDSVTIPLYADDGSGGISNPYALGFNGFYLKVRTPCADTEGQPDEADCSARYALDSGDGSLEQDTSVILWQILGEETDGTSVTVIPNDETTYDYRELRDERDSSINTEIYEDSINSATDYVVLEVNSLTNSDIYGTCTDMDIESLSLQLDIVTPLMDSSGSVPYLEWQLSTESTSPFGDTKAVIIGEGYHQGQSGIFYYPFVVTRSTTGESTSVYTLSN